MTRREIRDLRNKIIEYKGYINDEMKSPCANSIRHAEALEVYQSIIDDARERLDQAGAAHY